MSQQGMATHRPWPACIGVEEASRILGWPVYFFPVLVRIGHLKPLGKPAQNSRKWFATAEIERLSQDVVWLDKAVRLVEKHVHDLNAKQRGKDLVPALASQESLAA
jgi:hypothetical protein